ncbi:MAG: ribosome silencing factor [Gammaproteobacteria bacterium]|nr:ribosome silencing factor [Gammaproteobacteria bacterium]
MRLCDTVTAALDEAKGLDISVLDVRNLTDITDYMVVVTGTSDRHIKTLAARVQEFMLKKNWKPLGMEGEESRDWILVDYVDVVVHIMRDRVRKHYDLEGLWNETFSRSHAEMTHETPSQDPEAAGKQADVFS